MHYIKNLKDAIGNIALPLARLYIRYTPFNLGKKTLWKHFSYRERDYLVRTQSGTKMQGKSIDLVQGYIYYFGIWEPNLTNFITTRLKKHSQRTFIDIGANVGYFSLIASRLLPSGTVVSIEAFPQIYQKLLSNLEINSALNVRTVNVAATDSRRQIPMFHAGNQNEGATTSIADKFNSTPTLVEGLPLSDILTEEEIESIRLIKIDVEGAEYSVIQGMKIIIPKLKNDVEIIVEINPRALGEKHMNEIFDTFRSAGFFPYVLSNSYDPDYYLLSQKTTNPIRMTAVPDLQTDVVFSRVDAAIL